MALLRCRASRSAAGDSANLQVLVSVVDSGVNLTSGIVPRWGARPRVRGIRTGNHEGASLLVRARIRAQVPRSILIAIVLVSSAMAGTARAGTTETVLHDCRADGVLDRSYSFAALDRAYEWRRHAEEPKRNEPVCDRPLRFELSAFQRPVRPVLTDCLRDGRVDRRFSRRALDLALALVDSDIREFSNCEAIIAAAAEELPRVRSYTALAKGARRPLASETARRRAREAAAIRADGPVRLQGIRRTGIRRFYIQAHWHVDDEAGPTLCYAEVDVERSAASGRIGTDVGPANCEQAP